MTAITFGYATKGDTTTAQFTFEPSTLMAVYTDSSNRYVYAVDDKDVVLENLVNEVELNGIIIEYTAINDQILEGQ